MTIPQNGERLLEDEGFMAAIDGLAKEDLFYEYDPQDKPTPEKETNYSRSFLDLAVKAQKKVLTLDYVSDPTKAADAYKKSRQARYIPYVSLRELDRLVVNPGLDPEGSAEFNLFAEGLSSSSDIPRGAFLIS